MSTTLALPEVGSMVKVLYVPSIHESQTEWAVGQIVKVDQARIDAGNTRDGWDASHPICWAHFTDPNNETTHYWYFTEWESVPDGATLTVSDPVDEIAGVVIPPNCSIAEYRGIIERLANDNKEKSIQYEAAVQQRDRLQQRVNDAHSAIEFIGTELIEESNKRGWCEEFDRLIAQANERIEQWGYQLPIRQQDYTIDVTITGTITTSYTFTVTAANEDAAREIAESDLRYGNINLDSALTDAANSESFDDIDWDIESVDVE